MGYDWTEAIIGRSIDANLQSLYDFLAEYDNITDNGNALCAYNVFIGYADNCPTLLTLFNFSSADDIVEVCRDMDEVEIVDVFPDREIVQFRSTADDDYESFVLSFSEADALAAEVED